MISLRMLILVGLCFTAACETNDPYPYSPQFAAPVDVPARSLPAPPEHGSPAYIAAVDDILMRQAHVDTPTRAAIHDEVPVVPEMIVQHALGTHVTRERFPKLYALLLRSGSDAHRISDHAKDYWHTTRPYLSDARVQLLVKPIRNPSYPSGHTLIGHVWAGVLADVAPCKRAALFTRAQAIADHRITAGAHYRYDIDAGKIMAALTVARMQASDAYSTALARAQRETQGFFCS